MTPRSFFTIVIKIIGLYLVLSTIVVLPQFIQSCITSEMFGKDVWGKVEGLLLAIIILALYYWVLRFCLFKPDWIIDKLHLAEHFAEEKFELNISQSSILSLAIIITGAIIFGNAIPRFCSSFYDFVSTIDLSYLTGQKYSPRYMIYHLAEIFIGYILMTNSRFFVNLIQKNTQQ